MWKRIHVKYQLFFSDFNETWIFSTHFQKTQISNFIKISPVGAELFNVDGQTDGLMDRPTDMTKLIVTFNKSSNALKKSCHSEGI
jgi:hypothetical protein